MPRHIAWFIEAPVERQPIGGLTSKLASARYRCLIPARALESLGVRCTIFSNLGHADAAWVDRELQQRGVDIVVVGKLLGPSLVELSRVVRRQGRYLIADFCDDFFDDPWVGSHYRELAQLANKLVASTSQMAEAIGRNTGRSAVVISDPYEGPKGEPKFAPLRERLELLWFGSEGNIHTLGPAVLQLAALSEQQPLRLTVVTAISRMGGAPGPLPPNFSLNLVEWSPEELWRQLAACDAVIIPSSPTLHYFAKSPNRLIETIWSGRAVAAHPVASYREFRDVCWLGENIAEGVAWMLGNREFVARQIAAGQALIARKYAPAAIAAEWLECFHARDASPSHLACPPSSTLLSNTSLSHLAGEPSSTVMSKISVLTSITGGKDRLIEGQTNGGAGRIAYCDETQFSPDWEVRKAYDRFLDPRRNSRLPKILCHQFCETEYSIWIDGNIQLLKPPQLLVERYLKDHDIALFKHPTRDCIYDEAIHCAKIGLDDSQIILEQITAYERSGYAKNKGLYDCSFIIRRHTPQVVALNDAWWSEYCRHSVRDQISFPVAVDKVGIRVNGLEWWLTSDRLSSPRDDIIKTVPHITSNPPVNAQDILPLQRN